MAKALKKTQARLKRRTPTKLKNGMKNPGSQNRHKTAPAGAHR